MEKPIYPSPYMRIIKGYMEDDHMGSYAIDEASKDASVDYLVAPFTGIIRRINTDGLNEVWLESVDPVIYPDGVVDYMTVMFANSDDVSSLFVGQVINRGAKFYLEGNKEGALENHVHIECGRGKFSGNGWYKNLYGYYSINNGKKPTECFFIDDSIMVLNSNGYTFKSIFDDKNMSSNVLDDSLEINNNASEIKLIFTCKKTDLYAINLKEGQKLYLE